VLVKVYTKAICTPWRVDTSSRTVSERKVGFNYLGSVLAEIGDLFRALDEAGPL
jgi:hypothetical protein